MGKDNIAGSVYFRLIAIFCVTAVALISIGVFHYRYEAQRIKDDKYEDLSAIAKLKSNSIQDWRNQRLADVRRVSLDPLLRQEIARFLQDPMNSGVRAALQIELNINRNESVYEDGLFLDTSGNILLSDNPNPAPVDQATITAIQIALKEGKEMLGDFFRAPNGFIYIDALAPILDNSGQPIAIVALRSNAAAFLYPFIQAWPTPSKTAETLLVCRDGDSVLFLNNLRHKPNTALTLRFPLTDTHLPAVQAVLGNHDRFLSRDYRGEEVLAVSQAVPQSPWFIVAKVDAKEILAEVTYRAAATAIIVLLLILISAILIISLYQKRQEVERKRAEKALQTSRDELEIRVRERTAQLEQSNEDLQAFAFIAAHDLQEPLRKVITFGKLLKENYSEALGEKGQDYLQRMVGSTERMRSFLDSLLEYSRIATMAVPFIAVDLTTVFRDVLSDLEVTIQETGAEIQAEDLPVITADPAQMRQLFQNLIGNALKFHKEGVKPLIRVRSVAATEDETLQFVVEDNGIGFDPNSPKKL